MPAQRPQPTTPSFKGLIGSARADITPPTGIYSRCWAAAAHDVSTGVHRPLTLTCLTFQSSPSELPLVLLSLDLMTWRAPDEERSFRHAILESLSLPPERLMVCLTHTHSSPALQLANSDKPGGHLIAPYLDHLRTTALSATKRALSSAQLATLTWRYGACDLATNRDLPAPSYLAAPLAGRFAKSSPSARILCGHNPNIPADDTLLVGRITNPDGAIRATLVNYACHPTTLAWQNSLLSPDYVGAMRDAVESHTHNAPCFFLQGASGELAPAEQYTADTNVADRHGRRLAYAVLSTLESMGSPDTTLAYDRTVESGAPLAVWTRRPAAAPSNLSAEIHTVDLPLKPADDTFDPADPLANEKLARRRAIRQIVGDGPTARMPLYLWRMGNSLLLAQQNEAYSNFQTQLRASLPHTPLAVMNLTNGSGGYLPPAEAYDADCYQVSHSPFARGALEQLIHNAKLAIHKQELSAR